MTVLQAFKDGSLRVEIEGVQISVSPNGGVCQMSDWGITELFVRRGILSVNRWKGHGMYGHDTYSLVQK